mgnify:CR=1 FL=1
MYPRVQLNLINRRRLKSDDDDKGDGEWRTTKQRNETRNISIIYLLSSQSDKMILSLRASGSSISSLSAILLLLLLTASSIEAFLPSNNVAVLRQQPNSNYQTTTATRRSLLLAYYDEGAPSDYDSEDLTQKKTLEVDTDVEDATIRDELKRELLLLASVTNRGDCASTDEQNILIDLVNQLEALNPTADPASNCEGDWSLCLSSTQLFRSSPFFQSLRVAAGDANKQMADNGFELHDRATTGSRIGRVRQTVTDTELVSEVELMVGVLPGLPFRVKGTVVTTADLKLAGSETWELGVSKTQVIGSNVPILNQFLDDLKLELPVGDIYKTVRGDVPVVKMKVSNRWFVFSFSNQSSKEKQKHSLDRYLN